MDELEYPTIALPDTGVPGLDGAEDPTDRTRRPDWLERWRENPNLTILLSFLPDTGYVVLQSATED